MRAVEIAWIDGEQRRRVREAEAKRELHRLTYGYFLNRLTDAVRAGTLTEPLSPELRAAALQYRRERAAYLGVSEAAADAEHGDPVTVARSIFEPIEIKED